MRELYDFDGKQISDRKTEKVVKYRWDLIIGTMITVIGIILLVIFYRKGGFI